MILKELKIKNFRNYKDVSINFSPKINIIYGDNAQGKTNLLESIFVLGITKSHRSFIDNNLIKKGEKKAYIKGIVEIDSINTKLEIIIENKNKQLKIDDKEMKKISDYISKMNIIIFYPEDLGLIKGSPLIRRKFVNLELSQLNSKYFITLSEYNHLLRIRNECLKKRKKNIYVDDAYFNIITNYMIDKVNLLYNFRQKFINELNEVCTDIYKKLTNIDNFFIKYKPSIYIENKNKNINFIELIRKKYCDILQNEIKLGATLIGPHRDDIEFYIGEQNLKIYGSQGQQRLAVLTVKLVEIEIFKKYTKTEPILLLDDVFSELDDKKKNKVLQYINNNIQTIITTTDLKNIDEQILNEALILKIEDGNISYKKEV